MFGNRMRYRNHLWLSLVLALFIGILTACGGSTTPAGSKEVQVTLSDFKVVSSVATFSSGTPYHFVVTNTGKVNHEFIVLPAGMHPEHMSMDALHKTALAVIDTVALGETKSVDLTFPQSAVGQNLEFACHLPGHYEAGMKLPITVS